MFWHFRCRTYTDREVFVYRGLAIQRDHDVVKVLGRRNAPLVTASSRRPIESLRLFVDGVLAISTTEDGCSWDGVPWELHLIDSEIARNAAYRGWASQNGRPSVGYLINQLDQWLGGDLYEI